MYDGGAPGHPRCVWLVAVPCRAVWGSFVLSTNGFVWSALVSYAYVNYSRTHSTTTESGFCVPSSLHKSITLCRPTRSFCGEPRRNNTVLSTPLPLSFSLSLLSLSTSHINPSLRYRPPTMSACMPC